MSRLGKNLINKNSSIYIAVGFILIAIMTLIGTSVFVRILDIEISGTNVYTREEVLMASRVSHGDNLMRLNAQTVSQNIRSSLPFVRDVVIERRFPDTLLIEIFESFPIAYILLDGNTLVLDFSGRILQSGDYSTENLIEIRGVSVRDAPLGQQLRPGVGEETRFQDMQEILAAFEREGIAGDISYLDVSNIQNIHFGYIEIYRVTLGNAGDIRHKLHNLISAIDRLPADRQGIPGSIDASDPEGYVRFNFANDMPDEHPPDQIPENSFTSVDPEDEDSYENGS
ncbi:MAG: FtsQ-type POTRA domain-containing protein [Oscillospiraceae bacterium]|nr:FtsQ-type POTRA domain-containing protein [Oscillospiraceae bacterium]MCL2278082.1 FtsQ-type POTRA domain-containing protein [Oscillospiraceae bacterium]